MTAPLFMGVQGDPELAVWLGRGLRVYDGTRPPTEGELALLRAPRATAPPTGRRGARYLPGGETCICGECLFEERCPAEGPREAHHVRLWPTTEDGSGSADGPSGAGDGGAR